MRRNPPGVRVVLVPTLADAAGQPMADRAFGEGGRSGGRHGCWVTGERRDDAGMGVRARGFLRKAEIKPWDQLGLDF